MTFLNSPKSNALASLRAPKGVPLLSSVAEPRRPLRTCGPTELAPGHHHDLDPVVGRGKLGLNSRSRRRIARRHPGVPDGVHFSKMRHVSDPDTAPRCF